MKVKLLEISPHCLCSGVNYRVCLFYIAKYIIRTKCFPGPLAFLASAYRTISSALIDAERLLELLKTEPSIKETPGAKDLRISNCEVEFDDVCFSYDERKATLKNVSFFAPGGKTIAFVGETGGGKSTMLKLMDRFYDVKSGSIKIDGQDIRDVTMHR